MTQYVCIPQKKNDDPNYRYKMPQMKLSQESRLNGVKTNITNLVDVARALRVPESAILKYFCAEVGANAEGTTIVKGQHLLVDLARHLDKFIMKYVCCKKCKLPEITHEVVKKNLIGICRSCGTTDNEMDTMHKAGKQLLKDIQTYYKANPGTDPGIPGTDPGIDAAAEAQTAAAEAQTAAPTQKESKKKKRKNQEQAQAAATVVQEESKRAERAADTTAEVNKLDSVNIALTDENIENACEELKTFVAEKEAEGTVDPEDILREVRQQQFQLNVTPEYKFYICLCAIFGPHRNIVKHWDAYQGVFMQLMSQDEEMGPKHLLQALIQFFVNRYPEMQKFAPALCKKLYDGSVIEDQLFVTWHGKTSKLDKDCALYDRKAEKTMRPLLDEFVAWLSSGEYDEEEAYGEEEGETAAADGEEEKKEELVETEDQKKQRMLIETQKRAQDELAMQAKAAAALKKEEDEKKALEQQKQDAAELSQVKSAKKVADIAVDEGFDIDDI